MKSNKPLIEPVEELTDGLTIVNIKKKPPPILPKNPNLNYIVCLVPTGVVLASGPSRAGAQKMCDEFVKIGIRAVVRYRNSQYYRGLLRPLPVRLTRPERNKLGERP